MLGKGEIANTFGIFGAVSRFFLQTSKTTKRRSPLSGTNATLKTRGEILLSDARELLLELFHAASRVDETLFASVGGVRICRNVAGNHKAFYAVDSFNLLALHCRTRYKACARRNVYKANGMDIRMDFIFHIGICSEKSSLALLRLEAGIGFVDDVNASLSANHFAVGVTAFQRFD